MALNLEDKKALVAEVSAVASEALSVVAAEYRGMTVSQMTDLRSKARAAGVYVRVVKNTLARRAVAARRSSWVRCSRDRWCWLSRRTIRARRRACSRPSRRTTRSW